MDKKRLLKNFVLVSILLIIVQSINAQNQNQIVSKFEKVTDIDTPTLKISFHSWGEGRTEELNLDQYFPIKRDPNSRYVYLTSPEISVRIDQNSGIAYLTAFKDWTGTKEIIFSLTDIYRLETTLTNLQNYREIITQQRAPIRLKQQFNDLPSYHLFEKILDDLESSKIPSPRIEVAKVDNNIKVSVGKDTKLELDLETLTEENLPTLKPKIEITIQPEQAPAEELEEGLSIFIFIPLILIIITFIIVGIFYIKNNKEKLKKHFKKSKLKPTAYNKLIEQKRELSSITNKIDQQPIKDSVDAAFTVIKNFFNAITPVEYQFSYSEVKKELFEKELSESLKDRLCKFSREISDIRFSGSEIQKSELKDIIKQAKHLINSAAEEEKSILVKKERERLKKTFPIKIVKYILDSFASDRKKISVEKIKEKIDIKKKSQNILHKLGIIKTLAEKELARKRKYKEKLNKIKGKEHRKEQERRRKEEKIKRKKLLKLKEKQQKEHLKWLEAQRRIREIQKKHEEKRRKRLERAKAIRNFLHKKFGIFKTIKDIEKGLEEKRKKQLEKEREKRAKRKLLKRSVLNFMHFLRLYKTPSEKHEKELILKKEERLKQQQIHRRKERRKQAILSFLHKLKLYRTREEVEKEKERRLRRLREKQRKSEERYQLKAKERQERRREKQNEKLRKLNEKQRIRHLKRIEKARKAREKELARTKTKENLQKKRRQIKKYLHDNLGLFKTLEEKESEREQRYREKLNKQKAKERQEEIKKEARKRKRQLELRQKEFIKKQRETRKAREKELARTKTKENLQKKRRQIKKYLHDNLGLFKTLEEKESEREQRYREKLNKQKAKERQEEIKKEARKRKRQLELRQKEFIKKQRETRKATIDSSIKKFFHAHFGLYKTKEDLDKEKKKLREEIAKKHSEEKQKDLTRIERKRKLKAFLHDHLGLFKTREEIERSRLEIKEHRIELEHKLEDTVLKSLASRLERRRLTPEQEIKILMQLEQEALHKGETEKSKEIQNRINKLYKKIRRSRSQHPSLFLSKLKNNIESARDHVFSSTSKLDPISPFIRKINSVIRGSLAPNIENAKLDQISYLINKVEIELRRNKKDDAKEYYKRAVYLYRSLNKASQKIALPTLLKVKNEITSTAIIGSLEKAFSAIYTGQVKRAEKIYRDIDANFLSLPIKAREGIYDKKEELYQKINEQKEKRPTPKESSISQIVKKLFVKDKRQEFYPIKRENEEDFKPKQPQAQIKEEKPRQQAQHKKESFADFILSRRPKFTSIKTEIQSKKHYHNLTQKLFNHIRSAEMHLQKKDHERAHHNYRLAIDIFKDLHLAPEIRDNVYNNLNSIKERILHTSINNFIRKTKESVKKEEVEEAKKFHKSLDSIYNHLQKKKEKEISELMRKRGMTSMIQDSVFLERKLNEAFSALRKNNVNEAFSLYNQINNHYNNLKPEEKKAVYPRLITLYSELLKRNK